MIPAEPETYTYCAELWPPPLFSFPSAKLRSTTERMMRWWVALMSLCRSQPASSVNITSADQVCLVNVAEVSKKRCSCSHCPASAATLLWLCVSVTADQCSTRAGEMHKMFSSISRVAALMGCLSGKSWPDLASLSLASAHSWKQIIGWKGFYSALLW